MECIDITSVHKSRDVDDDDVDTIFTARKRSLGQGFTGVCLSTGGGAWSRGVGVWSRGVPGGDPPGRLLLRAVRILLECILVVLSFTSETDLFDVFSYASAEMPHCCKPIRKRHTCVFSNFHGFHCVS